MKSTKSSSIDKELQSHPGYLGLELNGDWYVPKRKKNDVCNVLQEPLCGAPVANSKFGSKGVKKMGSNNNNKKNNLVQMDPKV